MDGASTDPRPTAASARTLRRSNTSEDSPGRFGGTDGNEFLTSTAALVLTLLLAAEGVTILRLGSLLSEHMFIGLMLLPPIALKLASTGYRFARYYSGARAYRLKGPPALPLRLLAPILVAATLAVFATGVALLLVGHRSGALTLLHKASFIVWGACFAAHFLSYLPRMLRSVRADWGPARRPRAGGSGIRGAMLFAATAGGVVLAAALLGQVTAWHR